MSNLIMIAEAELADLVAAPIRPDWILAGAPKARNKTLAMSKDRTSRTVVWECTAGSFNWHFAEDETIYIIAGEVFVTTDTGEEKRLGKGDVGFFPAGSSCICRIDNYVRKVAVLRKDLPALFGIGVRGWHKFVRNVGVQGQGIGGAGDPVPRSGWHGVLRLRNERATALSRQLAGPAGLRVQREEQAGDNRTVAGMGAPAASSTSRRAMRR